MHSPSAPPLSVPAFARAVRSMPLVALDLIVSDAGGRILVGLRRNPPAKGVWFVPGGRIRKDETLATAWNRIIQSEIGLSRAFAEAAPAGVFEHLYADNFLGNSDFTTHYIVLAYCITLDEAVEVRNDNQHDRLRWMDVDALLAHPDVHENTKAYFRNRG